MLSGCEVTPSPAWQTAQALGWPWQDKAAPAFDPRFEYLALTRESVSIYMALGYRTAIVDSSLEPTQVVHEHWYSSRREVLVLEDGRLHQTLGSALEWRAVRLHGRPRWQELVRDAQPQSWTRVRDEMPGYRYGVVDLIRTRRVDPGVEAVPEGPLGLTPAARAALVWVRDDVRSTLADGNAWHFSQWFALTARAEGWGVVWSRQCLAPQWCFDLQPVAQPAS